MDTKTKKLQPSSSIFRVKKDDLLGALAIRNVKEYRRGKSKASAILKCFLTDLLSLEKEGYTTSEQWELIESNLQIELPKNTFKVWKYRTLKKIENGNTFLTPQFIEAVASMISDKTTAGEKIKSGYNKTGDDRRAVLLRQFTNDFFEMTIQGIPVSEQLSILNTVVDKKYNYASFLRWHKKNIQQKLIELEQQNDEVAPASASSAPPANTGNNTTNTTCTGNKNGIAAPAQDHLGDRLENDGASGYNGNVTDEHSGKQQNDDSKGDGRPPIKRPPIEVIEDFRAALKAVEGTDKFPDYPKDFDPNDIDQILFLSDKEKRTYRLHMHNKKHGRPKDTPKASSMRLI